MQAVALNEVHAQVGQRSEEALVVFLRESREHFAQRGNARRQLGVIAPSLLELRQFGLKAPAVVRGEVSNDLGHEPLQIVIKMTRCNGQPVAKISDAPGKMMDYDPSYVAYLRQVFDVPEPVAAKAPQPA